MIKLEELLSHQYPINKFVFDNVIFSSNDLIITEFVDIHSSNNLEFKHMHITIHFMGKPVMGLVIGINQTKGNFVRSHENYGNLISGIGLN